MIIGEAPGKREDDSGKAFVGPSGKLLERHLKDIGLSRSDVFISNAVHCRPEDNRKPSKAEIKACRTWLDYELSHVKPKYVLTLGNTPLESLTGSGGIKKRRGKPFEQDGMIVMPTYHPAALLYDPTNEYHFKGDLERFRQIIEFGGIPYERSVNPIVVSTWSLVERMLDDLTGTVSADCETTSLYPWDGNIVTYGFGTQRAQWILPCTAEAWRVPWSPSDLQQIFDLITERLADCYLVGHNWKFDRLWARVKYGVDWRADFDTMLAHYAINENERHGLDTLAQYYFGAPDWDVDLKLKQGKEGKFDDHCLYLAQDLYYTRKLRFRLQQELDKDEDVKRVFYRIIMPCSDLFTHAEYRGVYVDASKFENAEKYLRGEVESAERRLKKHGDINWASPKQIAKLLYTDLRIKCPERTKKGAESTSESTLKQIEHPAVEDLLKFRGAKQQLSFFIDGWKPYLVNNRLHPSFKIHGTVTGRLSCEHPNLQQVPRDPRIRSLITAPAGWTLLEADLSQIEMRIAAELSGDPELRYCFENDVDVHWRTMINSINSDAGGYAKDVIKTAELYCVQHGLPPTGASTEILQKVWDTVETGQKPEKILRLCREGREDQESRSGQRRGSEGSIESRVERWLSDMAEEISGDTMRAVCEYEAYRLASQERKSPRLDPVKFADALSLLSRIGPSIATELHSSWKEGRKKAKAVGFGYLFGMWWKKFKIYARDNYDIKLTDREAQESRTQFFNLYRSLTDWHNQQRRFAHEYGYVRSLSGRLRRLPDAMMYDDTPARAEAQRQAINAPVQSFANELNLMSAIQLAEEFPRRIVQIVGTVHDAVLVEVKNEYVEQVYTRLLEIMSWPRMMDEFGISFSIPIEAEAKLGPWSQGVSLDKWLRGNPHIEQRRYHD